MATAVIWFERQNVHIDILRQVGRQIKQAGSDYHLRVQPYSEERNQKPGYMKNLKKSPKDSMYPFMQENSLRLVIKKLEKKPFTSISKLLSVT